MKGVLKDQLNVRNINGLGFVQSNLSLSKLDEIITHNKVTSNHITGEREEQLLHLVEDRVSSEYKIMIFLQEERDNGYCGTIEESQNPFSIG